MIGNKKHALQQNINQKHAIKALQSLAISKWRVLGDCSLIYGANAVTRGNDASCTHILQSHCGKSVPPARAV